MADVLSVIADIIKQDKVQKREHAKVMREVQKKLKEKELPEEEGDGDEYQKFVQTMLKKFGVKSPAELSPEKKKEFYDALDAGWEGDNEKPEPEDKEKEESLGDRVKARMEDEKDVGMKGYAGEDSEEDEDEDPVGDPDEAEDEAEEEPADEPPEEQIDKIADLVLQKIRDKADEEEAEEEEPETTEAESGKKEKIDMNPKVEAIHRNPHSRTVWEEALRKVYENTQIDEHCGECEESIEEKKGSDYELYHKTFSAAMQHAYAHAKKKGYTVDPDEVDNKVATGPKKPSKGKTNRYILGTDKKQNLHVQVANLDNKRYELNMYIEEVEIDEKKMFSGKGEFEVKYASSKKGPIKVSKFNTLDDAKKFLAQVKGEGMNGIISKGGKPVKEEVEIEESAALQMKMAADDIETYAKKHGGIDKKDMMKVASMLKKGDKKGALKYTKNMDSDPRDWLLKTMGEETIKEDWIDNDARKVERKWSKMAKSAKKKWMDKIMDKAEKEGMPEAELMDVLDDYGITMEETSNLQKLKDWGINVNEASKEVKDRVKMFKNLRDKKSKDGWQKTGLKDESVGMQFARKHYQKDKDSI
jgi:hypothetical protein